MTSEERDLINGLFERLKTVAPAAKDAEAEQLIQRQNAFQPDAPYLLVQTLLVQEHALQNAQLRINHLQQQLAAAAQLQQQPSQQGGGFLSGLFNRCQPTPPPLPPFPTTAAMGPAAGGGFLRSALATAAGVAGGSLLFQGIEDLLGHRAGAFEPMLGSYGGGFGGGSVLPAENVDVTNNYFGDTGQAQTGGSFLQTGDTAGSFDQSMTGADLGNAPALGTDWGSNIDPGPAPDAGGGFDIGNTPDDSSGNMAV